MYTQQVMIQNEQGFHIRPAQLFVEQAVRFQSNIQVRTTEGIEADAKSILSLMSLGLDQGSLLTVSADGPDEQNSVDTLIRLIESGFGET